MRRPPGPEGQQDSLREGNDRDGGGFQLGCETLFRPKKKPFTRGCEGL
jgi:hypothetical protein